MDISKEIELYQKATNNINKIEQDIYHKNVSKSTYDCISVLIDCLTDIIADEKIIILIRVKKALKKDLDVLEEFRSFKKEVLDHITNILEEKLNSINELINLIEVDYPYAAELPSYGSFKSDLRIMSREIKQFIEDLETIPRIN